MKSGRTTDSSPKNLSLRAIQGLAWMVSTNAAQGLLQIAILVVLARLLSPAAFGIVGGALVVMRVADVVGKLGVGNALVQRDTVEAHHLAAALVFFTGWGFVVTVAIIFTAPNLATLLRIPELAVALPVMAVGVLVVNVAEVSLALLRRDLRFRVIAMANIVSHGVAYGVVGIALAALGFGYWSLVWAFLVQLAVRSAMVMIARRHHWRLWSAPAGLRDLLIFGGGMTVWRLTIKCGQEFDNLVVARMLGAEALGLYRRAHQLSTTAAVFFSNSVATVVFPVASKLREPERLGNAYLRGIAGTMLLGLPAGTFLAAVAPEAVAVVLGPQWTAAAAPMAILALGLIFHLSQQVTGSIVAASGMVYAAAWRHAVHALAVLIGALIGQFWGLVGIACGVLAAQAMHYAMLNQLAVKITALGWPTVLRAHVPGLLLTVAVALAAWPARLAAIQLDLGPLAILLVCTASTAAMALLVIRMWPRQLLGDEGLWLVERVLRSLPEASARRVGGVLGVRPQPTAEAVGQ
jgi:PST family polysaccharide transporter